jgi:hypothetical protein
MAGQEVLKKGYKEQYTYILDCIRCFMIQ